MRPVIVLLVVVSVVVLISFIFKHITCRSLSSWKLFFFHHSRPNLMRHVAWHTVEASSLLRSCSVTDWQTARGRGSLYWKQKSSHDGDDDVGLNVLGCREGPANADGCGCRPSKRSTPTYSESEWLHNHASYSATHLTLFLLGICLCSLFVWLVLFPSNNGRKESKSQHIRNAKFKMYEAHEKFKKNADVYRATQNIHACYVYLESYFSQVSFWLFLLNLKRL